MVTRYRGLMLLLAVLITQLLVMAYQLRRNQDIPAVRHAVVYVVAPVQKGLEAGVSALQRLWSGYVALWSAQRRNQALVRENDELKLENQRLREQAEQGRRLQVFFDLQQQLNRPMVAAQVLSSGSSETARIVMIDKGANHGLRPDLPVLVPEGIVGKVLHVFPTTAQVLLITDPYSGVACLLEGSRVHGILRGQNQPVGQLHYVPNGDEIQAGQLVLTSGDDKIFPKGLPVGVVLEAKPGPEFQQILVQPLARLNRLEEVLVILQPGGDIGTYPLTATQPAAPEPPQMSGTEAAPEKAASPAAAPAGNIPAASPAISLPATATPAQPSAPASGGTAPALGPPAHHPIVSTGQNPPAASPSAPSTSVPPGPN